MNSSIVYKSILYTMSFPDGMLCLLECLHLKRKDIQIGIQALQENGNGEWKKLRILKQKWELNK